MPATLDIVSRLHRRLLDIVATALPLMPSAMRDADLDGLAQLRAEMVETMAAYRRHSELTHAAALCCGDPAAVDAADALCRGTRTLERAYAAFRDRWAHREALAHWAEYRLSAIRMMKQVREQVRIADEASKAGDLGGRQMAQRRCDVARLDASRRMPPPRSPTPVHAAYP